jgi:excisionase family DNA binding protein
MEDRLLTVTQAAEVIGVRPITVRRHIAAGHIAYQKPGRDYLILESEAIRFRDSERKAGRPPKSQG